MKLKDLAISIAKFSVRLLKFIYAISLPISFLIVLTTVVILVKMANFGELSKDYSDIFLTTLGAILTVYGIMFSIILIPVSHIASQYSPRFLVHIVRDKVYWLISLFAVMAIMYNLAFGNIGGSVEIFIGSVILLAYFFVLLVVGLVHTIRIMNPKNSILRPEKRRAKRVIRRYFRSNYRKKYKLFKGSRKNRPNADELIYNTDNNELTDKIEKLILPLRDVTMRAIKSNRLEETVDGIDAITSVVEEYIVGRRKYQTQRENLLTFLATEFESFRNESIKSGMEIQVHPEIIRSLLSISNTILEKTEIKKTYYRNSNDLLLFPVKGIYEISIANIANQNSYSPIRSVTALRDIGIKAADLGYIQSTYDIVGKLKYIVVLYSAMRSLHFVRSAALDSMKQILLHIINNTESTSLRCQRDYSTGECIDKMYEASSEYLKSKISGDMFEDDSLIPITGYILGSDNNIGISEVVANLIYRGNIDDRIAIFDYKLMGDINEKIYSRLLYQMMSSTNHEAAKEHLLETIYRSQIYLLSVFVAKIRKSLLMDGRTVPKNISEDFKQLTFTYFVDVVDILLRHFVRQKRNHYTQDDFCDVIFSLFFICIEYRNHLDVGDRNLADILYGKIKDAHGDYKKRLPLDGDETFYKYIRLSNQIFDKFDHKYSKFTSVPKVVDDSTMFYGVRSGGIPMNKHSLGRPGWRIIDNLAYIDQSLYAELNNKLFGADKTDFF
ncbi:DUF2254 domain-containing protein [Candidatus Saccharibacteria bacterium]|nr:DUF2254 domain-containing protein [Candidatus Saccharibacteria bacterium]